MFVFCLMLLLSVTSLHGSPTLTIINATRPFVFEANAVSEVYFSVDDIDRSDFLDYTVFINHKHPGSNVSRLRCYLTRTPQACTSNNENCECLSSKSGHHYKLKAIFRQEDCGNWNFKIAGKEFSFNKSVHLTVVSRSGDSNHSALFCGPSERHHQGLIFDNSSGPFVFKANTTSELRFSFEDNEKDSLTYTIYVNHKPLGTSISGLKCYFNKTPETCIASSKDCECLNDKGGHDYRLKKVFQEEDSGEWMFSVHGKGLSVQNTVTVTVFPGNRSPSSVGVLHELSGPAGCVVEL